MRTNFKIKLLASSLECVTQSDPRFTDGISVNVIIEDTDNLGCLVGLYVKKKFYWYSNT